MKENTSENESSVRSTFHYGRPDNRGRFLWDRVTSPWQVKSLNTFRVKQGFPSDIYASLNHKKKGEVKRSWCPSTIHLPI